MAPSQAPPLAAGTQAPSFTLNVTPDQRLTLEDCSGNPVVLVFYPADWSPVCSDELAVFNELLPELKQLRANVLAISVDSAWCHAAFARDRKLHMPLLADFEPKGRVSRAFRAYREEEGVSDRVLYVLDGEGKVFWSYRSPVGVNPGADGVLEALERLNAQSGGRASPAPGQEARVPS